ncbi:MFS transporter [Williamwhitmania taraxaci]|uniref:Predicted arabinose efflux permease, MFS family n=1 Tax=Williamwhitmania taraxaci TaxID=1640674 RepID=A0A1G6QDW0_9BACT|nr:MFS transporter [Williamwhitmania taraxaci]SDC90361.1 Predicted arabinose efflux permease, MFS family [Williamwhitmania taraxaci]
MPTWKQNLYKLYYLKIVSWFLLFMPVVVIFFQSHGLSLKEIFILQSVYSLSIVLLEIPSGYLADLLGRKNSLVIGNIFGFIGFTIYIFTGDFTGFLMAEVVMGFGMSMISGADSAILYDTLLEANQEKRYLKEEGIITGLGNYSEAIAGILGGLLAGLSIKAPFIGQAAITLTAIPVSLWLYEPVVHRIKAKASMTEIWGIVRYCLVDNRQMKWNIILSSITGASTLTMAWFAQPYFEKVGVPLAAFGILWTILNFSVGFSAFAAHRVEARFGLRKTVIATTLILSVTYILLGLFPSLWALSFLLIFYLARGVATPVFKNSINKISPSESRATVLSVRNFIIRIVFGIVGPLFGWLADRFGLMEALIVAGVTFTILQSVAVINFLKTNKPD